MNRPMYGVLFSCLAALAAQAQASEWTIDAAHTNVGFKVKHLVISTVNGRFNKFTGSATYDEKAKALKDVKAAIEVASIDTNEADRDKHLRGADFFDADTHPTINFEASKVDFKSGSFTGKLTMRGVTKDVPFKVSGGKMATDPWGNTHMSFEFRGAINRKDFGILWNKTLDKGGVAVADMVDLVIEGEAVQKKAGG